MTLLEERERELDETARQARAIFVASLRDFLSKYSLDFGGLAGGCDATDAEIRQFADLYGWPDTLRALAQAMQVDEQMKAECEARR